MKFFLWIKNKQKREKSNWVVTETDRHKPRFTSPYIFSYFLRISKDWKWPYPENFSDSVVYNGRTTVVLYQSCFNNHLSWLVKKVTRSYRNVNNCSILVIYGTICWRRLWNLDPKRPEQTKVFANFKSRTRTYLCKFWLFVRWTMRKFYVKVLRHWTSAFQFGKRKLRIPQILKDQKAKIW